MFSRPVTIEMRPDVEFGDASRMASWMWGVFGVLAILGLATPNPWLTAFTMLVPPFLFWLLWRPGEPPVLAFATAFQWLQAASPVIAADIEWRSFADQPVGSYQQQAAWLSLIAIAALAIGMATVLRRMPPMNLRVVKELSAQISLKRLFLAYLASLVLSTAFVWLSVRAGGLRQPILALSSIKWVPLFLLCWSTLQCERPKRFMIMAVGIEIIIGFSGYFSSFKSVLFLLLIIAAGTASSRPRLPKTELAVITAITLLLVCFWQAVKVDYRNYLNQGTGKQVVLVSFEQRMQFLGKSAASVTPSRMVDGAIDGIKRLGYVYYFAHSIRHVPKHIPHQNGTLWIGAIKHVFMPRILFPDKEEINESKRTRQFTGIRVAGRQQGTSISIGYVGESYIDFGFVGMFVPIFLLGVFTGLVYRYFSTRSLNLLVGLAIASTLILHNFIYLGNSNIAIMGGSITSVIAFFLIEKASAANFWRWITSASQQLEAIR